MTVDFEKAMWSRSVIWCQKWRLKDVHFTGLKLYGERFGRGRNRDPRLSNWSCKFQRMEASNSAVCAIFILICAKTRTKFCVKNGAQSSDAISQYIMLFHSNYHSTLWINFIHRYLCDWYFTASVPATDRVIRIYVLNSCLGALYLNIRGRLYVS